jgi:hypothetical protein
MDNGRCQLPSNQSRRLGSVPIARRCQVREHSSCQLLWIIVANVCVVTYSPRRVTLNQPDVHLRGSCCY